VSKVQNNNFFCFIGLDFVLLTDGTILGSDYLLAGGGGDYRSVGASDPLCTPLISLKIIRECDLVFDTLFPYTENLPYL